MTIEIYLSNNREVKCDNLIIGKMNENKATTLKFILTEEMINKDFYIEFEKNDGTKFVTPKLEIQTNENEIIKTSGIVEYEIPNTILDIKGDLKVEVILKSEEIIWKSYTKKFNILNSINASEELPGQYPDFVSETQKVIDLIDITGEGNKYLSNDGTYKEVASGSSDYNNLENKPITYLVVEETPIYLNTLTTGKYIINGIYLPYKEADISATGNNTYIEVETTDTEVYVLLNDITNNNKEHYQIAIDGSSYTRTVISYNNLKYKETTTTNSRTSTSTTLQDNYSYQTSGNQTRITLKFPTEREVGFRCWYVFKTGDTIPTFTCDYDIKWHGDSVQDNVFTINANKYYTIEFWQDINTFNAEVREV